jgi:adenosine deaminase
MASDMMNISEKARKYAKVELHLHLDGSVSPDSAKQLAVLCNQKLGSDEDTLRKLSVGKNCRDLNEYLEKFAFPCSLLQSAECIELAVKNLLCELTDLGVLYSEIRFAPQKHTENGLSQEEAVKAAIDGVNKSSAHASLILCCMRGDSNEEENLETVRVAQKYLGKGVVAIDLAGAEALYPTANFEYVFSLAKELSVPFTVHAGEA